MEKYGLLFESVFKRKLTGEGTVSFLENVTKEHPYFSVAHFFLLSLSQKNENGYKIQARKAAVLFNNNHWLHFQLLEAGFNNAPTSLTATDSPSFPEKIADDVPAVKTENTDAAEIYSPAMPVIETDVENGQTPSNIEDNITPEDSAIDEPVLINEPTVAADSNVVEEVPQEAPIITVETISQRTDADNPDTEEVQIDEPLIINHPDVDDANESAAEDISSPEEAAVETSLEDITTTQAEQTMETHAPITEEAARLLEENTAPVAEPMLFEPLHTTDYFASVGIKLSEEEKTSDNLGKQLKSFTEWLKTMKKVHAEQLSKTSSPSDVNLSTAESKIQKIAEKSNEEKDVITEAMADVLLQQGKADKALEILEKLSLLNPGKSLYFAAKINQIKEK